MYEYYTLRYTGTSGNEVAWSFHRMLYAIETARDLIANYGVKAWTITRDSDGVIIAQSR